jgi:hypothetical protein
MLADTFATLITLQSHSFSANQVSVVDPGYLP